MPTDLSPAKPARRFLLNSYGLPHTMGFLGTRDGVPNPEPLETVSLLDAAVEMGLAGVEIPLHPHTGNARFLPVEQLREELQARNLSIVTDFMVLTRVEPLEFRAFLESSALVGATVVRALISPLLCGDRRSLTDGWDPVLEQTAAFLREVLPVAEDLGLSIAMEDHQDTTSADLLRLAEMVHHSPAFGICLDTGNPLAVGEGPVEFARRIGPLIRHLHLKDYTIHFAPEGYHLVRCPAGTGCVDFPTILRIAESNGFPLQPGVEVAAQPTRTIALLEDSWWECYPPDQRRYLPEALRVLWQHGIPATEPYSSLWETGGDSEAVIADEWNALRRSVTYFQSLPK
ncbi:MAG: sugar phosphate isomerase/epimerase [Armatimonadaceae bacterium]